MGKVCVVGSANVDLVVHTARIPSPGETVPGGPLATLPGGKSANQSVAAARLGADVTFVGRVGDDDHGTLLLESLARSGVDVTHVHDDPTPTGTAMILIDDAAENVIVVSPGANGTLSPQRLAEHADAIRSADVLGLCFEIPMETVESAAAVAHRSGATVVLNPSPFTELSAALLQCTDVLVVNEHEFAQVFPGASIHSPESELLQGFRGDVVVTLGARGAALLMDGPDGWSTTGIPAPTVEAVDTTGCGDAFTGALLAGLADGDCLEESIRLAVRVGAVAATGQGAQPSYPTREELTANPQ